MKDLKVGDLVRDVLNAGDGAYGIGVVVKTGSRGVFGEDPVPMHTPWGDDADVMGRQFDVYFTKFERVITFHADYLEKV